jgi:hypothetical protein
MMIHPQIIAPSAVSNLQRFACSAFRNKGSDSPKAGRVRHDHQTGAGNSFIAKSIVSPEGRSAYRERPFQSHLYSILSQCIISDRPEGSVLVITTRSSPPATENSFCDLPPRPLPA